MEAQDASRSRRKRMVTIASWVLGFLLVVFIFISELGLLPSNPKEEGYLPVIVTMLLVVLIMIAGALLTLLLALLPPYKEPFWGRWINRLPFGMLPVLLLGVLGSAFSFFIWIFTGYQAVDEKSVRERPVPEASLCEQFHHGRFKVANAEFERRGDLQIEYNTEHLKMDTFQVRWLEPCSYILIKKDPEFMPARIHITEIHTDGYTCIRQREGEDNYRIRVHYQ